MGRITVFTGEDFNSLLVLKVLKDHDLPYSEISLVAHPERLSDLKALTGKASVPRVFFNTRPIGGVEEIVRELRRWERSSSSVSSSSFLESSSSSSSSAVRDRYEMDIATHDDPGNPRLALPSSPPVLESEQSPRKPSVEPSVDLMDGTKTTFFDITEKLKNSLSFSEIKDKNVIYKKAFSGKHLIKTLEVATGISNQAAIDLAQSLQNAKVFHAVSSSTCPLQQQFVNAEDTYYRLQCHKTPHVLNSYRHWDKDEMTSTAKDPVTLLADLDSLLHMIEIDSAQSNGLLDCTQALRHPDFGLLEELVSQLQTVNVSNLPANEVLPFSLNIYGFMLRYAFIKVGIPLHEGDRLHFLNHVAFGLNGHTFTLGEWVNGVLRGNTRAPNTNKPPFEACDSRCRLFALRNNSNNNNRKVDHRIHYALNVGAKVGNRTSLPFQRFTAENFEEQLELVSSIFWEDGSNFVVDLKHGEVSIPKSIGWYMASDFGRDVSEWMEKLNDYLPIAQKHDYSKMQQQHRGRPKVTHSEVNWAKNACNFTRYDKEAIVAEMKGLRAMITRRFLRPAVPANESERLEALTKLNILDTLPEERFDRITQMVQARFGVSAAAINFVGRDRNWAKSMACSVDFEPGATGGSMKRETNLCSHAILSDDIMVVPDILQDDRYADCPSAKAVGQRFYASCPLNIPSPRGDGSRVNVGTLAIFDVRPRDFSKEDEEALRSFGDQVKACLDYSQ